jgi:hypothetical protein
MGDVRTCNPYEPDFLTCAGLEPAATRWNPYVPDLPADSQMFAALTLPPPPKDLVSPHVWATSVEDEVALTVSTTPVSPTAVAEPAPFLLVLVAAAAFAGARAPRRSA